MTELKNDRFLRALLREPVDRTPVWMMRQAGRYLPEYRASRAKAGDFMRLCSNPDLACEVTLQPLDRYPAIDAAILFSDILTIPDAMGLGLYFESGEGPKFRKSISSEKEIEALPIVETQRDLPYVPKAVTLIHSELNGAVPLIGFSGSPWTLATYMVEGGSSKDYAQTKQMMYGRPDIFQRLIDKLVLSIIDYLNAQIKAGAQAIQIFDSWGGALSCKAYHEYSLKPMSRIIDGLIKEQGNRKVPVILFTKGGGQWLETMASSGADCLGLDWTTDIADARRRVGDQVSLQGNMDPALLCTHPERIRQEVAYILQSYGKGSGHIFNLGHGVTPQAKPENVGAFFDAVEQLSSNG